MNKKIRKESFINYARPREGESDRSVRFQNTHFGVQGKKFVILSVRNLRTASKIWFNIIIELAKCH